VLLDRPIDRLKKSGVLDRSGYRAAIIELVSFIIFVATDLVDASNPTTSIRQEKATKETILNMASTPV
jgi:hypothetical protein